MEMLKPTAHSVGSNGPWGGNFWLLEDFLQVIKHHRRGCSHIDTGSAKTPLCYFHTHDWSWTQSLHLYSLLHFLCLTGPKHSDAKQSLSARVTVTTLSLDSEKKQAWNTWKKEAERSSIVPSLKHLNVSGLIDFLLRCLAASASLFVSLSPTPVAKIPAYPRNINQVCSAL